MRDRGPARECLRVALMAGAGTTRELAMRTGLGVEAARYTLRNMVQAGDADLLPSVRVPGVKRPVPVYGSPDAGASDDAGVDWGLIDCWAQWPQSSAG